MTNLNPEICRKIKDARRAQGISQSVLAREVGCKQSALSMFEQGDGRKLNDEVIAKLAERFGISLVEEEKKNETAEMKIPAVFEPGKGFCPNPHCPGNHAYNVEGRTYYRPDREICDPVGGKFCAVCGEVLEKRCPNCGSPVHDGAVCSYCGQSYVAG
jgi:transcriptional regulator with XRE-family HTH domain